MPGADTWSAKEYKGYIYASDMARGFDVYSFTNCQDAGCVLRPTNTPGSAAGGGKLEQDFATFTILRGSAPGGEAQFGMDFRYVLGAANPVGSLTFQDKALKRKVQSTSIDSLTIAGTGPRSPAGPPSTASRASRSRSTSRTWARPARTRSGSCSPTAMPPQAS